MYLFSLNGEVSERLYPIEINRAYEQIRENQYIIPEELGDFPSLKQIVFLAPDATATEKSDFFSLNQGFSYIRPLNKNGELAGYLRFDIHNQSDTSLRNVQIIINGILFIVLLLFVLLFLYIRRAILQPFHQISNLPFELSKGTLVREIPQPKSRYFGRFIWGLNMLRETLDKQKEKELKLLKERKTMVLSLSHDIKTPLSAIQLNAQALSKNLYVDEKKRLQLLSDIYQKSREIESFVGEIMKTSKEELLAFDVPLQYFYFADLMKSIEEYYRDRLVLLQIDFQVAPYDNHLVWGNLERLKEVLQNIIENGIKYGDGKLIGIRFCREENFQLITIYNSGNTLPKQEQLQMFNSFWRGSNSEGKAGNGLGLYICKQLLTLMEG